MNTFSEQLLIPMIHFVLLGFLPMGRMRTRRDAAYGTGCGQLFVARRGAYWACGGHSAISATLHDGLKLPRVFRAAGFKTDLFDATGTAECRMYSTNLEVWHGFGKNAHEALGSPGLIGTATLLLIGGQVLPPCVLCSCCLQNHPPLIAIAFSALGTLTAFLPRPLAVRRFGHALGGALLHPIGVCSLITIQWIAFLRSFRRRLTVWKGRSYPTTSNAT